MKITRKSLVKILCFTAISFCVQNTFAEMTPADEAASEQQVQVVQATEQAEVIIEKAESIIEKTREQVLNGEITADAAGKIIIEQTVFIAQAKQELQRIILQAVQKVDIADEKGDYLDYFVSGAKNIGAQVIVPLKDRYYGYTEFEREIARKTIKGLVNQQEQLTQDYEEAMDYTLTAAERETLKKRYEAIIAQLNNEIYQQKLITGEEMSPEKKLFWAAVTTGAALVGMALLTHYSGKEVSQDMVPTILPRKEKQNQSAVDQSGHLQGLSEEASLTQKPLTPEAKPKQQQATVPVVRSNSDSAPTPQGQEMAPKVEPIPESTKSSIPTSPTTKLVGQEKLPGQSLPIGQSRSLQEQADIIGEQNATKFMELSDQVLQAQTELDSYKATMGENADPEMIANLQDKIASLQSNLTNFSKQAIKEKEDFEREVVEQQQKEQEELQQAGQQMISEKKEERRLDKEVEELEGIYREEQALEEAKRQQMQKEQEELQQAGQQMIFEKEEERRLDKEVEAMEADYNEEQEKNTQLINESNILIESIKSNIAETIKVRQSIGDEEGIKLLQSLDQKYTDFVNAELARGRSPQEIYTDLVQAESAIKLQTASDRNRALSTKKTDEDKKKDKAIAESLGLKW